MPEQEMMVDLSFYYENLATWRTAVASIDKLLLEQLLPAGPAYSGKADPIPWSGYWWPMLESGNPNLYDQNGPLEHYDQYAQKSTGVDPDTVAKEKVKHHTTDSSNGWWGHCNGWASSAILEPEPKQSKTKKGVLFDVGDLKGILSELHWYDPCDLLIKVGGNAHIFHRALIDWMGKGKEAVVLDISPGSQVWNYAAGAYRMRYTEDAADSDKHHVTCTVYLVSDHVAPDFVGVKGHPDTGRDYTYWIKGDLMKPTKGGWEGNSTVDHPDLVWHPIYSHYGYHGAFGSGTPKPIKEIFS